MKKILMLLFLAFTATGFADQLFFNNLTKYPTKNAKMAMQWANSAKQVDEENRTLIEGSAPTNLLYLSKTGKTEVSIPQGAQHFRVLVWTKAQEQPDLHTNWVDVVPNKTYTLKQDQLVPIALIHGSGC